MIRLITLPILLFPLISKASEPEVLCPQIKLIGTQGSLKTVGDFARKNVLLMFIDEITAKQWPTFAFLKDLEAESLDVLFVFQTKGQSERIQSQVNEMPLETFSDGSECFKDIKTFPWFRLYGPRGTLIADSGDMPPTERLLQLALPSSSTNEDHLFTLLGKSGVLFQSHENDCAPTALTMLLERMGIPLETELIFDHLDNGPDGGPVSLLEIKSFLSELGLKSDGWIGSFADLQKLELPVILHLDGRHFVVMTKAAANGVLILDPKIGRAFLKESQLSNRWKGVYFSVNPI